MINIKSFVWPVFVTVTIALLVIMLVAAVYMPVIELDEKYECMKSQNLSLRNLPARCLKYFK